ncbi:MAG: hypothetical protein ACPLXP_02690 [Microgenomates group bacterium]
MFFVSAGDLCGEFFELSGLSAKPYRGWWPRQAGGFSVEAVAARLEKVDTLVSKKV